MNLILDTHTFLWQSFEPEKIPKTALSVMENIKSCLYVSTASLWEIGILSSLKRIELNISLKKLTEQSLQDAGVRILPIEPSHIDELRDLPFFHRDPFDRLMIAQAINIGAAIIGKDLVFERYGVERIWK